MSGKLHDPAALPPRKPAISCSTRWAGNWMGCELVWRLRKKRDFYPVREEKHIALGDGDVASQVTTSIFKNPEFQRKVLLNLSIRQNSVVAL